MVAMRALFALFTMARLAAASPVYQEALPGYTPVFPRDHFEHPGFRTEWWYYTGNVWTKDGRRFGFELVFFREGEQIGDQSSSSAWRIHDVYLANAALTDIAGKRFSSFERLNRAGPGIAGASFDLRKIWNGNWSDEWSGERQRLRAATPGFRFEFECARAKNPVLHGDHGLSQKAEGAGHASYYVSFPLLTVVGMIHLKGSDLPVSGQAWMDHEWFTHQLGKDQAGWDWFSVQLEDKTELMLFDLRRGDGTIDPYSSGTYIDASGQATHLKRADFELQPAEWWTSGKTRARYPVAWIIRVPRLKLELRCRAKLDDQELSGSRGAVYWEGAVDYGGSRRGVGYLEMTGYDKPMRID